MLNCRALVACSSDYLDGRLGLLARLDARRHLMFCADCRCFIRQLAVTREVVRHLPDASPGKWTYWPSAWPTSAAPGADAPSPPFCHLSCRHEPVRPA